MSSKTLELHPYCSAFPEMDGDTLSELTTSMQTDGFKKEHKILMFDGKILDGRNRYNAAIAAGRKPVFEEFKGSEAQAKDFVLRENLIRRHLTPSQRSAIAADLSEEKGESVASAAKKLGVSQDSVAVAKKIKKKAPEVAKEIKAGKKTLNRAEKEVAPPKSRAGSGSKEVTMDNLSSVYGRSTPASQAGTETKTTPPDSDAKPVKPAGHVAYEAYYEFTGAKDIPEFDGLATKEMNAWNAAAAAVLGKK